MVSLWCLPGIRFFFPKHILGMSGLSLANNMLTEVPRGLVSGNEGNCLFPSSVPFYFGVPSLQRVIQCMFLHPHSFNTLCVMHLDTESRTRWTWLNSSSLSTSGFRTPQEYVFYSSQIAFVHKSPQKGCRGLSSLSHLLPSFQAIPILDTYTINYFIKLHF